MSDSVEQLPASAALPGMVAVMDCFTDPVVVLDPEYHIVVANQAYRRLYCGGACQGGRRCYELTHRYRLPCDQMGEDCPLGRCLNTGERHRVLHVHHTPLGPQHVEVESIPLTGPTGATEFIIEVLHPVGTSPVALASGSELVGRSPVFQEMLELMRRVAPSESAVLLLGESGTGKELVARAIHQASRRAQGPFVPVECSGLTDTLFESELFGHEKGAFTGAYQRKTGLVEAARGGTLFLDEIGDIPLGLQVKLLRLLETRAFRRVGGVDPQEADFRLVCATHRALKEMVDDGSFRRDLYYRISTFPIRLPPLRERADDLPVLVETLLQRVAPGRTLRLEAGALARLQRYAFPGNVRELRNLLERATLLADGDTIGPEHLPDLGDDEAATGDDVAAQFLDLVPLDALERRYLQWAAGRFSGSKRELARKLGLSERSLYRKLTRTE